MTDRSLSSTNLTCSRDYHTSTLVSNLPQHTTHSLCWLDTTHRRLPHQCFLSSSEPAEHGWVFCHLLPWCEVLDAPRLALGAESLMCCTVKQQLGRRWPTWRRMLSMLLAFFTALAFCFLLLIQNIFLGDRNCLWPVMGGGFSVTCFPITGNGRGQVSVMEVLSPMSMFARLQPALVPSGYSLDNVMGTDTSNMHFKVQLCSARPRQSWVQHEYKVDIKLQQCLCILLGRENGEEKCHLQSRPAGLAQGTKPGDIHTAIWPYPNAVKGGDLTSGSGSPQATDVSVLGKYFGWLLVYFPYLWYPWWINMWHLRAVCKLLRPQRAQLYITAPPAADLV